MHWYLHALKNYAEFSGRASRAEFWTFVLVNLVIAAGIEAAFGMQSWPARIFHVLVFIPTLAVTVRRLHDASHSGAWVLLLFVPIIGWLPLLVFMLLDSKPYTNAYGTNAKDGIQAAHA